MPFHTTSLSQTVAEQYNIPDLTRSPSTERDLFLEKPGKAVKMGESIESEGFIFTVNSYMTTKKGLLKPFQKYPSGSAGEIFKPLQLILH